MRMKTDLFCVRHTAMYLKLIREYGQAQSDIERQRIEHDKEDIVDALTKRFWEGRAKFLIKEIEKWA